MTTTRRILHLALELRRAHTAPVNFRRVKEATALLVTAAGELDPKQVAELDAMFAEPKEDPNAGG
jgi:hypothetical protein